jgi:hypothetical protein
MTDGDLSAARIAALTADVDIDAPPPDTAPTALILFGTNQPAPARIAADRYHRGLAPLIIATGGVNRHNGIVEGREFARQLAAASVPASAVRIEDQSKDTWQNVELSMPYLREALAMGLPLVAVSKWYHLRAVYCVRAQLPEAVTASAASSASPRKCHGGSLTEATARPRRRMVPGSNELHPVRSSTGARVADTRGYTLGARANAKPERATGAARPRPSVESRRCTPTVLAVRTPSAVCPWTRNTAVTELQGRTPWGREKRPA